MENNMEIAYVDYGGHVKIDLYALIIYAWNKYVEYAGCGNKIFLNNKEFFENSFNNSYDAAWAVALSGKWCWRDEFAYFNDEGYITSFNQWDDKNSPIDLDKIDVGHLIDGLGIWHKKEQEGSISKAIHDALK